MTDVIAPLVTPFDDGHLNTTKLLNHAKSIEKFVDIFWLCGSTGLGPALSKEEKETIAKAMSEFSNKVIFQVGSLNIDDSIHLAKLARRLKVQAIASYPPFYFPKIPEDWVVKYFTKLSKIYPLYIYNYPEATKFDVVPSVVRKIVQGGGNIVGVKDTINDITHMLSYKWEFGRDFVVYSGSGANILPAVRSGIDGVLSGAVNFIPEFVRNLVDNATREEGFKLQRDFNAILSVARKFSQWASNYSLVRIFRGYDVGKPRPPIYPLTDKEEAELEERMKTLGLIDSTVQQSRTSPQMT